MTHANIWAVNLLACVVASAASAPIRPSGDQVDVLKFVVKVMTEFERLNPDEIVVERFSPKLSAMRHVLATRFQDDLFEKFSKLNDQPAELTPLISSAGFAAAGPEDFAHVCGDHHKKQRGPRAILKCNLPTISADGTAAIARCVSFVAATPLYGANGCLEGDQWFGLTKHEGAWKVWLHAGSPPSEASKMGVR